jgi:hypothetical protein
MPVTAFAGGALSTNPAIRMIVDRPLEEVSMVLQSFNRGFDRHPGPPVRTGHSPS